MGDTIIIKDMNPPAFRTRFQKADSTRLISLAVAASSAVGKA